MNCILLDLEDAEGHDDDEKSSDQQNCCVCEEGEGGGGVWCFFLDCCIDV